MGAILNPCFYQPDYSFIYINIWHFNVRSWDKVVRLISPERYSMAKDGQCLLSTPVYTDLGQVDFSEEDVISGRSFPSSKNVFVQKMIWLKTRQHD